MLASMPGNAAVSASPKHKSFASHLTGFATQSRPDPDWRDDGPEDDIATLSYEQALRTHARIHPVAPPPFSAAHAVAKASASRRSSPRSKPPGHKPPAPARIAEWAPRPTVRKAAPQAVPSAQLRSASVTVRLSVEERAQLQQRAAAAGLTASAYLRSCLFEAEALRAQVKEALEQFRTGAVPGEADKTRHAESIGHGLSSGSDSGTDPDTAQSAQTRRWWLPLRWLNNKHARIA
jgi:hypothetical protein